MPVLISKLWKDHGSAWRRTLGSTCHPSLSTNEGNLSWSWTPSCHFGAKCSVPASPALAQLPATLPTGSADDDESASKLSTACCAEGASASTAWIKAGSRIGNISSKSLQEASAACE